MDTFMVRFLKLQEVLNNGFHNSQQVDCLDPFCCSLESSSLILLLSSCNLNNCFSIFSNYCEILEGYWLTGKSYMIANFVISTGQHLFAYLRTKMYLNPLFFCILGEELSSSKERKTFIFTIWMESGIYHCAVLIIIQKSQLSQKPQFQIWLQSSLKNLGGVQFWFCLFFK